MKLTYNNASSLLISRFNEMKKIYDNDFKELSEDCCHVLYSCEFVPYILKQIQANNELELKKIFDFIELLMSSNDSDLVNLAEVSVIESLYFDHVCETHRAALLKYCGKRTLQSFIECFDEEEKAAWENAKAA